MRVGTDAVLLGAWTEIKKNEKILEVGTGCGIIALMLVQRNSLVTISAIDIHPESIQEADSNFKKCPWFNRLEVQLISLQALANNAKPQFDHIVSNPPYFVGSTPSPIKARNQARHTDTLSTDDFFVSCKQLLLPKGIVSLVLPSTNSESWIEIAEKYNFFPSRITEVFSYPDKPVERILIEFSNQKLKVIPKFFHIRKGKGLKYSEDYIDLTGEFFL